MWWHVLPRPSFATPPGVGRNQEATKHGPRRIEWRRGTLKHGKGLKVFQVVLRAVTENWWQSWNRLIISHFRKGMDLRGTSTTRSLKSFQGAHREMDQLVINHAIHSCSVMLVAIYRIWDILIQDGLYSMHMFFHDIAFDSHTDMQIKLRMMCTLCFCPKMWVPK